MFSRASKLSSLAIFLFVLLCAPSTSAQTLTPAERIRAASSQSGIGNVTDRPWHLKLDVIVFDDQGKNPRQGTVEVWSAEGDRRTSFQFGDSTATRLAVSSKIYRTSTGGQIPFRAEEFLNRVMRPGPSAEEIDDSHPEVRKQSFGKAKLDCVMLSQPIPKLQTAPLGLFPTYCLTPDTDVILLGYDFGSEAFVERQTGKFLDHKIPTKLELQNAQGAIVGSASTTLLTTYVPKPDEFTPPADLAATTGIARVAGGVIAGSILKKVQPVYPESAKVDHVQGTVVLRAVIGSDGHVHSLRPTSAPDPDLAMAAIYAVRQWTYKPYMLNGEPTSIDTTITVNFALNQ
jgi:TonB family protein